MPLQLTSASAPQRSNRTVAMGIARGRADRSRPILPKNFARYCLMTPDMVGKVSWDGGAVYRYDIIVVDPAARMPCGALGVTQ